AFANMVNPALAQISDALARQRANSGGSRLSMTMTSAFATYWLMPRLADFSARNPDVEVNLIVSDRYLDLAAEGIDIAIRYTPTPPTDGVWHEMLRETIFPVYSPRYQARTSLAHARDLLGENLLYLSGRYRAEGRWTHWFQQQGLAPPEERRGVRVNTYINMLQAAIEGQGVALAGHPLVDRYLSDGSLLRMHAIKPLKRDSYYLTCRSEAESALLLCAWLSDQFAESGQP
ncbi:MAG: LysR substrate-binding domain-containing protein, partial [Pseudomonadota bacterium]